VAVDNIPIPGDMQAPNPKVGASVMSPGPNILHTSETGDGAVEMESNRQSVPIKSEQTAPESLRNMRHEDERSPPPQLADSVPTYDGSHHLNHAERSPPLSSLRGLDMSSEPADHKTAMAAPRSTTNGTARRSSRQSNPAERFASLGADQQMDRAGSVAVTSPSMNGGSPPAKKRKSNSVTPVPASAKKARLSNGLEIKMEQTLTSESGEQGRVRGQSREKSVAELQEEESLRVAMELQREGLGLRRRR